MNDNISSFINVELDYANLKQIEIIRAVGTTLRANLEWQLQGHICDDDQLRINNDWFHAEAIVDRELYNLRKNQIKTILSNYVVMQAEYFGGLGDKDPDIAIKKIDDDYYDAKRYLGFCIAEKLMERCIHNHGTSNPSECFSYICEDYIPYLISISIEEFLKIRAYHSWEYQTKHAQNLSKEKTDGYYYAAKQYMFCTMDNCHQLPTSALVNMLQPSTKNYITKISDDDIKTIIEAKKKSHMRQKLLWDDKIEKYTKLLYASLHELVIDGNINRDSAKKVVDIMYMYSSIPNMFEYLLKCIICSSIVASSDTNRTNIYELE